MKTFKSWHMQRIILLILLLAAWGMRLYMLDAQSFWNDEGNTARLVERPAKLIIEGAAGDIHPPGYYLMLHAWRAVAGHSEFALRMYSALCGTLAVALAVSLGRLAAGKSGACIAALLVTLHPLGVYYSQEARMYAQLGLVAAWLVLAAVRWERQVAGRPGRLTWKRLIALLAITLPVAVGLYTQYAFMFVILGLSAAFGVYWLLYHRRDFAMIRDWVMAHALGGALFLPWAPIAMGASDWQPPDIGAGDAISDILRTLVAGITLPQEQAWTGIAAFIALLFLAVVATRPRKFVHLAVWGSALMPPLLLLALGIYRPAYLKFLTASLVPLAVVLSLPLGDWFRKGQIGLQRGMFGLAAAGLLVLATSSVGSLDNLYHSDDYRRDDFRGIAAMIEVQAQPGDAILLSAPNQWEVFTYYYQGNLPVYPAPYRPTEEQAEAWLDDILTHHSRLFVLYWGDMESDPDQLIEPYLARNAYKAGDQWITSVRLAVYGVAPPVPMPTTDMLVTLGESIQLQSYGLFSTSYPAGSIIPLSLNWVALDDLDQRYKVFVQLLDAEGQLVAQTDMEPGAGFNPTDAWPVDVLIPDNYGVQLPSDLLPGPYTLITGMYGFDGVRLPARGATALPDNAIVLSEITVVAPE